MVQGSNSAVLDSASGDFEKINDELSQLYLEFNSIISTTQFNKKDLLNGFSNQYLQVGANSGQGITIDLSKVSWAKVTLTSVGSTNSAKLEAIDDKITEISKKRSYLGAMQNRLEYRIKVDDNSAENLQSAESTIRDTDMADEMTRFSKENILQQAATSMLAQANQANQGVLSLLQ